MIKTVPHGTVSPQMYKKYKRLVYTSPDLLARFCKMNCKLVERKKLGLVCFPRICFPGLIYFDLRGRAETRNFSSSGEKHFTSEPSFRTAL